MPKKNIDDYKNHWFVTVTLTPYMYQFEPKVQYNTTVVKLQDTFGKYNVSICAELTQIGNIHYHIIAYLPTKQDTYMFFRRLNAMKIANPRMFGRSHYFSFDSKENLLQKIEYIQKGKDDAIEHHYNCIPIDTNEYTTCTQWFPEASPQELRINKLIDEFAQMKNMYDEILKQQEEEIYYMMTYGRKTLYEEEEDPDWIYKI